MLKHRLITGVLVGLFTLASIFLFPTWLFKLFFACVMLLAGNEWLSMAKIHKMPVKIALGLLFIFILGLSLQYPSPFIYLSLIVWPLAFITLFIDQSKLAYLKQKPLSIIVCFCLLIPTFAAACFIQQHDAPFLGYLIVTTGIADSGAYFCGKKWGSRPLAKSISPNKSLEGLWGAVIFGSLMAVFLLFILPFKHTGPVYDYLPLGILAIFLAVMGDLFESLLKRLNQIKDSGSLLPGHGGVLDRLDSYLAVLPLCTVIGLWYLG